MSWVSIRSRRAPAFWAPLVVAPLLALLLGVLAEHWVGGRIQSLQELAQSDPEAARLAAERALRGLAWFTGGFCLLGAALMARCFQTALLQGRLPPRGWWSLGAHRAATGTTAQRLARLGLALATLLGILGVGAALYLHRLVDALLRARLA